MLELIGLITGVFPLGNGTEQPASSRNLHGKPRLLEMPWRHVSPGFRELVDASSHSDDPRAAVSQKMLSEP